MSFCSVKGAPGDQGNYSIIRFVGEPQERAKPHFHKKSGPNSKRAYYIGLITEEINKGRIQT